MQRTAKNCTKTNAREVSNFFPRWRCQFASSPLFYKAWFLSFLEVCAIIHMIQWSQTGLIFRRTTQKFLDKRRDKRPMKVMANGERQKHGYKHYHFRVHNHRIYQKRLQFSSYLLPLVACLSTSRSLIDYQSLFGSFSWPNIKRTRPRWRVKTTRLVPWTI